MSGPRGKIGEVGTTLPISVSLPRANEARQRLEKTGPAAMADVNRGLCPRRAIVVNPSSSLLVSSRSRWWYWPIRV